MKITTTYIVVKNTFLRGVHNFKKPIRYLKLGKYRQDMEKENLLEIERDIVLCKKRLKELEPYINTNNAIAIIYNQALVQKAILTDKYNKLLEGSMGLKKKSNWFSFFNRRKRPICDYFMK